MRNVRPACHGADVDRRRRLPRLHRAIQEPGEPTRTVTVDITGATGPARPARPRW